MNTTSKTDWEHIDSLVDETIDTSDIPPLSEQFFRQAHWRAPVEPLTVMVHVDAKTLAWFQARGEAAEREMAAALRIYADAHQAA